MKKINRSFLLFWIDLSLISIDICQQVTCNKFKINVLKNEKNEKAGRTVQFAGNGVFDELSIGNNEKRHFLKVNILRQPSRPSATPP
jgi:hypothetical protein